MLVLEDVSPLQLSPDQRRELEDVVKVRNGRTATILRARIILHRADGHGPAMTARELGIPKQRVEQWEQRFRHHGTAGLNEARDRRHEKPLLGALAPVPANKVPNSPALSAWQKLRLKFAASSVLRAMVHGFMTVAGLTLLAKGVSFLKDADVVRRFGISDTLDAFTLAFGVHTFASSMLGGGVPNAFLTGYSRLQHEKGPAEAEQLAVQSALSHGLTLTIAGVLIYALSPQLVAFLGHGFPPAKQVLALQFMRSLLPVLLCYGMTLHLSMWLRGNKLFALAAAAPILTPATILAGLALTGGEASINTLVWGTNLGSALHLLVLVVALARRLPREPGWFAGTLRLGSPDNRTVLASALPFVISGLVLGGAPMVDQAMAARLESGSVTVLGYADKVCTIILALSANAAAEALFPFFADVVARRNWQALKRQLLHTTGVVLAFAVPLVALLIWQAPLVVKLLFQRGSFDPADTERVAAVLRCASLQIPFYIASLLMSKVVIALRANWFTLLTATISLGGNIVFNLMFMRWYGVAGIALSTAVVYALSMLMMGAYLMRAIARLTREERRAVA